MKVWSTITTWTLVSLMAINIAGTAYYFVLKRQTNRAKPQPALAEEHRFPAFSGIDVLGAKWEARDAPCRVIRIADDQCSYCKKDKPSYTRLVDAARRASCEIIEISPRAGGMAHDPRPGIVQLKFVDADIGSVLFPFVTPQTVILDGNWSVKMTKRGMFNEQSLESGMAILGKLAPPLAAR